MDRLETINECFCKETVEEILLSLIREGRKQRLDLCMAREYLVCAHVVRGTVSNDFFEWEPSQLCQVGEEMVDKFYAELDDEDFECLQLPARLSPGTEARAKL
ncbi:hypothetical protein RHGRI_019761 [Rhododendron griersonianum]|uniref:3-hydroxyisobutyryl-CoA hydrolase n=1 Tax=Rhododendron griersonianum TaxID=479676 RepID=A0AAV6JDM9_9ERIC|nr:hypothetical protein RHGRI_019761 [Rhododendron griersonianum]